MLLVIDTDTDVSLSGASVRGGGALPTLAVPLPSCHHCPCCFCAALGGTRHKGRDSAARLGGVQPVFGRDKPPANILPLFRAFCLFLS